MISINGKVKNIALKLYDVQGYFKRAIEIKRLEKYSNEIDMVLTKYNKKSCDETMMVKGLRKSDPETTNRKTHQEDLEKIVARTCKGNRIKRANSKYNGKTSRYRTHISRT